MDVMISNLLRAHAVWNKVLNGMWKANSSLPVERAASVQNAQNAYLAPHSVNALDFPWEMDQLPDDFQSPAWAAVRDPVSNGGPACAGFRWHLSCTPTFGLVTGQTRAEPASQHSCNLLDTPVLELQGCGMPDETACRECACSALHACCCSAPGFHRI